MRAVIRPFAGLLAFLLAATFATAHEGHDHGAPPPPVSTTIAPRADASSSDFELVAVARDQKLTIHLDRFSDNAPVTGAMVEVDTPAGTLRAKEEAPGDYGLAAAWIAVPGRYDLAITIDAAGTIDVLTTTLTIPAPKPSAAAADAPARAAMARVNSAINLISRENYAILLVGGGGFLAGLSLALLLRRRPAAAVALLATGVVLTGSDSSRALAASVPAAADTIASRDVAQRFPDGALFVPKSTQRILAIRTMMTETKSYRGSVELPGRIIPDPNGVGYVQASVAGRLMPPPTGFPRLGTPVKAGDVLAHVHPGVGAADVTTQQQQARDLDQQIALANRKLERLKIIANVVARAQIEDAEIELSGLRARRANLDKAPAHIENLVAPVSGVISAVSAVAGQIAETNSVVFQLVDPNRFWVEALSYEAQAISGKATARFADGRTLPLAYRGAGLSERNQAIPVQFEIEGETSALRAGQLLTVLATTSEQRSGIAVPREAVLRGPNGQQLVFEHTNAERFAPREVRTEPLDGRRVLIVSGVETGKRIVTQGAELINQIR